MAEAMMRLAIVAIASIMLAVGGCQCLPVPTSDSTGPETDIHVDYVDTGGVQRSLNLPFTATSQAIVVRVGSKISIRFSSHDPQGVKSVSLGGETRSQTNNSISIGEIASVGATNGCPRESIFQVDELDAPEHGTTLSFFALGTNWVGATSLSPQVTVTSN